MSTVTRPQPEIVERAHVWHYVDSDPSDSPVDDGERWHGVAAHLTTALSRASIAHPDPLPPVTRYDLVPVDRDLPAGWRWAGLDELEAIRVTHPAAIAAKDAADQMLRALFDVFVVEVDAIRAGAAPRAAGWLTDGVTP